MWDKDGSGRMYISGLRREYDFLSGPSSLQVMQLAVYQSSCDQHAYLRKRRLARASLLPRVSHDSPCLAVDEDVQSRGLSRCHTI